MRTAATPSLDPRSAVSLIGGQILRSKPQSSSDWITVIRNGIPSSPIDSLAKKIQLSHAELAHSLAIPERTLARRKKLGMLNSEETAKLVRLARVIERATEVFDNFELAINWLKSNNAALTGETPLSLLDTDIGAESIMDLLGRIEHGVFS